MKHPSALRNFPSPNRGLHVRLCTLCLCAGTDHRLLIPGLAQGMLMLDRGDGSAEDIDKSLELGAGHPMGPLTLAVRWACRTWDWKLSFGTSLVIGSGLISSPCPSANPRIAGLRGTGYLPLHSGWLGAQVPERTVVRRTGMPEAKSSRWKTWSENGRGVLLVGWRQTGDCCTLNTGLLASGALAKAEVLEYQLVTLLPRVV